MQRISKEQVVQNLNRVLNAEVGHEGLLILMYGWLKWRNYGKKYRHKVYSRKWLYIAEVYDLSEYAQYDLSR